MTTFIRIEHPETKRGIWRHNQCSVVDSMENANDFIDRHFKFKNLQKELLEHPFALNFCDAIEYFCGFKTVEQFQQWIFQSEILHFVENGFRIYKITAEKCLIGEDQVFFKPSEVTSKVDITDIFI